MCFNSRLLGHDWPLGPELKPAGPFFAIGSNLVPFLPFVFCFLLRVFVDVGTCPLVFSLGTILVPPFAFCLFGA